MSKSNPSTERRVEAYLSTKYYKMFIAYCRIKFRSRSSISSEMIRETLDKLPAADQENLLRTYDKMTPEERIRPKI